MLEVLVTVSQFIGDKIKLLLVTYHPSTQQLLQVYMIIEKE